MQPPLAGDRSRRTAARASAGACISATAAGSACPTASAEPEDAGVEARVLPSAAPAGARRERKEP